MRLQMKTNYISETPPEYEFMRRFPPLHRDTATKKVSVKPHRIPYIHLYKKAVGRNPLHADEKVYPAYWMYEPSALILARKQYQLMQDEDLNENDAYRIALMYLDDVENSAYVNLKELRANLEEKKSVDSFVSDPVLVRKINYFKFLMNEKN